MNVTATFTQPARSITPKAPLPRNLGRATFTQKSNAPVCGFNVAAGLTLTASISAMSNRATPVFGSVPLDTNPNPCPERHYGTGRLWSRQARLAAHRAKPRALSQARPQAAAPCALGAAGLFSG
jgi:hypothetical protein